MQNFIKYLMVGLLLSSVFPAMGHIGPKQQGNQINNLNSATLRTDCDVAQASIDQSLNNVRTTLLAGGDVWWNGNEARYVVPKVDPLSGLPEVSSIFAGAVWLGGFDPAGNLKIACQQYGTGSGNSDFYTGPLTETGTTSKDTCSDWDRFFKVTAEEIDLHLANVALYGSNYDPDLIPNGVKFWPGRGNPFFNDPGGYDFELPGTEQGLAGYHDAPLSVQGIYDPDGGDYPIIEIRGCQDIYYPDEMIFWIYNDAGNAHTESGSDTPIRMEVQVQAFSYKTSDEINDMTFMRYKLINRAIERIDSTFFAMWVDPDLGCYLDDYIGCDTSRSLMYIYNQDGADGEPGFTCNGVNTYGDEIPVLGVDYFRGPRGPKVFGPNGTLLNPPLGVPGDTIVELGMSSFTYFNGIGATAGTGDPQTAPQYYNYLSGSWLDGLPYTIGGDGHNPGQTNVTSYAFPFPPDEIDAWSMAQEGLPAGDRRTVQASGPFRLEPGSVNELIVGVVWVPNIDHPTPDITNLLVADDLAQALFDNCFVLPDGPDAPSIDWVELDREVIAVFTNDSLLSNNAFELYEEGDLRYAGLPGGDSTYVFEGYKLFQLAAADVNISELDDPDRSRLVAQVDVRNDVKDIYNWKTVPNPTADVTGGPLFTWVTEVKVEKASNEGAKHLYKITEDQFATSDRKLINHKKYYFVAIAYGFNEHAPFNPDDPRLSQQTPYLQGRKNIGDKLAGTDYYTVIPRPILDRTLNAGFGDGPEITRLDGQGVGQNFVRLTEASEEAIFNGSDEGEVVYQGGSGPIGVTIYNPLELKESDFEVKIVDSDPSDNDIDENANWELNELDANGNVINTVMSERDISFFNEQILAEYGFALTFSQSDLVGEKEDESNGLIGIETSYDNSEQNLWYATVPEGPGFPPYYDFIKTSANEVDFSLDPNQSLSRIGNGDWVPYTLCDWRPQGGNEFLTPAWGNSSSDIVRAGNGLDKLNNVDIVFTSDKDKWSRCIVVETANDFYTDQGIQTEGGADNFDIRNGASVGKDGKPEGNGDTGMGWFPGYAIDVMTGERLNIFFGENSVFSCDEPSLYSDVCDAGGFIGEPNGRDMIWNPTSQRFVQIGDDFSILNAYDGGQHFIYVTREQYDECAKIREGINLQGTQKLLQLRKIAWTSFPVLPDGVSLLSVEDGLIPNDYKVSLRVDQPYIRDVKPNNEEFTGTNVNNRYPTYKFSTRGLAATDLVDDADIDAALDMINVVPNPYYGFSAYETSQFTNVVKITNLPAKSTVTIYSLDGKFIRQFKRDAQGIPTDSRNNPAIDISQYAPAVEWDLRNNKGIPVASGVYLIHVDAGDMGERVIKWFGVARQFDPTGL